MLALPSKSSFPTMNAIHHCDFFTLCGAMGDASVDMILCDLPYGTTACVWDNRIPLEPMWAAFKRIIKPNGAIVLTASQPFTSMLVMSNLEWFKNDWVWDKASPVDYLNVKKRPMGQHESVLVFSESWSSYNPILGISGTPFGKVGLSNTKAYGAAGDVISYGVGYPKSIIRFPRPNNLSGGGLHTTQKPVALFEYLIRTYTLEGQLVFDPCVGSGTTAVAAKNTGRRYICGDITAEYVDIARKRVNPVFGKPPKRQREVLPLETLPLFATAEGVI